MGGTGESLTLPREARRRAMEVAVKTINHRVPVIASVTELSVYDTMDMPMIIYNFPGRTGYNVNPDIVGALLDAVPNICGIKECSERYEQTMELIGRSGDRMAVLSGNEFLGP